jgi:hypothetical protein
VEKTKKADTGVAWAPESTDTPAKSAKIEAQLYDASGVLVETTSLPFEGHGSRFISEIFDKVGDDFLGGVRFKGDTSFFLTILRLENNGSEFQLTSAPPASEGSGEFDWIGPSGGIVSDGQGAAVRVPAGALNEELLLRVNTISDLNTPSGLNGPLTQVLGAASFGPSGLHFDEPVVVTIPLANPGTPGESMPIYQYYPEDGAWSQTKFAGTVNSDGRSVDTPVTHFSVLAILGSSLEYMDLFGDFPSRWHEGDLLGQYRETVFRVNELFSVGHKEPYQFPPRDYKCYEIVATTFVLDHNEPSLSTPLYDVYGTPPFDAPPCLQKKCFVDKYGPLLIVLRYEDEYATKQGDVETIKAVQFDINIWLDCAAPELGLYPPETPLKAGEKFEVEVCLDCGLEHLDRHEVSFQAVNGKVVPDQLTTSKKCSTVELIPEAVNCEDGEVLLQAEHFACAHERREEDLIEEKNLPFEFDLSGSWQWTEVADETDCEEGVNTYKMTASITVVGSTILFAVPGVNASATKSGCIIAGFGSEQEDEGISYGSGTLTIDPDGKRMHGTASWTWYGDDDEECSGTSQITATRN